MDPIEQVLWIIAISFSAGWAICRTIIYHFHNKGILYINLSNPENEFAHLEFHRELEDITSEAFVVFRVKVR